MSMEGYRFMLNSF